MSQEKQTQEVEEPKEDISLEDFGWDATDDFFGVEGTGTTENVLENISEKKEEEKEEKEEEKEEESEKETIVPFEDIQEEEEKEKPEKAEKVENDSVFTDLTKDLIDRDILRVELEEDVEIDEEKFFELQESEINSRVGEALEAFAKEFDEEGAAFIKFKKAGGTLREFVQIYGEAGNYPQNLDLTKERDQDILLRYALKKYENLDNEDIEDKLEWLEERGKKASTASKYELRLKKEEESTKQEMLKQQEEYKKDAEQRRIESQKILRNTIKETEEIKDFILTKNDKDELFNYMTRPTVKLENGSYISEMQAALQRVFANEDNKLILLAKLLKSDFDTTDVKKVAVTEETKKIKSRLKGATVRPKADGSSGGNKALADFFN